MLKLLTSWLLKERRKSASFAHLKTNPILRSYQRQLDFEISFDKLRFVKIMLLWVLGSGIIVSDSQSISQAKEQHAGDRGVSSLILLRMPE